MKLSLLNYLFLSNYVPLPLSVILFIEKHKNHPFHNINELTRREVENELTHLHKQPNISIRKITEKAQKIENLLQNHIIETIEKNIEDWKARGINILTFFDKKYPKRLKKIKNPPKTLFYKGNFNFAYDKAISIIGTRKPTPYGAKMARGIAKRFAESNFVIINGFAKGVDSMALIGGLEAGSKVIGVLGSGLLNPYPKANLELFNDIIEQENGVFLSELKPDSSVTKSSLAVRNRISSALSLGNVLIEGAIGSGARWQLKFGEEQGKPTIVLEPKEKHIEQAELPNDVIKNKNYTFIIKNIKDVDNIVNSILNFKFEEKLKEKQKSLSDF